MRILYISQRVPYPPTRGDKIGPNRQVRYLAERHEVSVACLAEDESELAHSEALARHVASVDVAVLHRGPARLRAALAPTRAGALTPAYLNVPQLRRRLYRRHQLTPWDAVIVYSSGMAPHASGFANAARIMQFADLDSQKWRQYADAAPPPHRWIYRWEANRLLAYERHLAHTFDHSIVISPAELEDFARLIPGAPASCVPNGVDADYFSPLPGVRKKPGALVFVGVMGYRPNEQGAEWFCHEVLPRVRAERPDVTVTFCGARPSVAVQRLAALPGVRVTGAVDDVRPYLAEAETCVIPLQMGRGLQNKVLEALAMGLPTVVTPVAATGLNHAEVLQIAPDAASFAERVLACLGDPERRLRLGRAGRAFVEERYNWSSILSAFEALVVETAERRGSRQHERRRNQQ